MHGGGGGGKGVSPKTSNPEPILYPILEPAAEIVILFQTRQNKHI